MLKKINIEGMSCHKCVAHVKEALEGLKDSSDVKVNLEGKYAIVNTNISDNEIKEIIEDEGYDVVGFENI